MSVVTRSENIREQLLATCKKDAEQLVDKIYLPGTLWVEGSKEDSKTLKGTIQKVLFVCKIKQLFFVRTLNEFLESRKLPHVIVMSAENGKTDDFELILRITPNIWREQIYSISNKLYFMHRAGIVATAEKMFRKHYVKS